MSHDETPSTEDAANVENQFIRLRLKEFNSNKGSTHTFFSHFRPDYLLEQLTEKLSNQGQEFTMSEQTWKLNFEATKTIGDAKDGIKEQAQIQVEILKVPGQDKYCVDFQRKAGSAILFYDHANKYIDLLEICNNTTLESDEEVVGAAAATSQ